MISTEDGQVCTASLHRGSDVLLDEAFDVSQFSRITDGVNDFDVNDHGVVAISFVGTLQLSLDGEPLVDTFIGAGQFSHMSVNNLGDFSSAAAHTNLEGGFMRYLIVLNVLSVFALQARADTKPPNVVVFLVDDLGADEIACYASRFHETPNIDALAAEGMRFTRAYSASTLCSPSRAALLTSFPMQSRI